ncbi:MAG TPA: hypothetical protein PLQ13_09725 [Candidatus Krumholzibacteria bacterium]|nr:hypothetical protein [Candidatus Krumholzibacteria bacterium]
MSANSNLNPRTLNRTVRLLAAAACCALALLGGPARAAAPAQGDGGIVLSFFAPDAAAVSVVGDFNGWNPDANPLERGADGLWSATVALPAGDQAYRFVVDGTWVEDPDNGAKVADPFGGFNSIVTVGDDGRLGAVAGVASAAAGDAVDAAALGDVDAGTPRAVDGGVLFTYRDPAAGQVFIAGSFNGWNASDRPLARNAKGVWATVVKLDAGRHTYKYVVDGNWLADPENGDVESDGYGGNNSAVTVDAKGKVVAGAAPSAAAKPAAGTDLNAKVSMSGRYLTRFEYAKNIQSDPRYRLLRPSMSADLNFNVGVNDMVDAFLRMRMDSNQNVILNNVAGVLDEAELHVHPKSFDIRAFWNREIFTSTDPLRLMGDLDLPGTIGHDHLDEGKGTAGAVMRARPFGADLDAFFANVYNADYYNDPDLFDNTGEDRVFLRLHHRAGPVEIGIPVAMQRQLIWFNLESKVNPIDTGIPALDDYLRNSGDTSGWFEAERHDYKYGLDLGLSFHDEAMRLSAQAMHVDLLERFVTGNLTSRGVGNGGLDVPFLDRQATLAGLRWDWTAAADTELRFEHVYTDQTGASADERTMTLTYPVQVPGQNQLGYVVNPSPAQTRTHHTELEASRSRGDLVVRCVTAAAGRRCVVP